jgi:murein DD-endopeptidase MepM/ murein hydrolase activator NlpD
MSQFDPQVRKKSKARRWLDKYFPDRQIMFRSNGRLLHFRFTQRLQIFLVACLFTFGGWAAYTSSVYLAEDYIVHLKSQEAQDAQVALTDALKEINALKGQLGNTQQKLKDDQIKLVTALKQRENLLGQLDDVENRLKNTENRRSQIEQTNTVLMDRLNRLNSEVRAAVNRGSNAITGPEAVKDKQNTIAMTLNGEEQNIIRSDHQTFLEELNRIGEEGLNVGEMPQAAVPVESLEVELRKVLLQRDFITSERDELRQKLLASTQTISAMQEMQMLVFQRMEELADKKIEDMNRQIASVGFDLKKYPVTALVKNQKDVGGPFIPVDAPIMGNESPLKKGVVSLNEKMDHWENLDRLWDALPLGKPLPELRVTSRFGLRKDPVNKKLSRHDGIDFGAEKGTHIKVQAAGVVTYAGWRGNYGRFLEIDHGMGIKTRYGHLNKLFVKKGDLVHVGQHVADVGNTGRSTGPHLHYEVRINNIPVNPKTFVWAIKDVFKG